MVCIDCDVMICVGATSAEAEEKAAKEQAARKKHKARLNEVQQEV